MSNHRPPPYNPNANVLSSYAFTLINFIVFQQLMKLCTVSTVLTITTITIILSYIDNKE